MKTDRELLELAAKAAGLVIYAWASDLDCPLVEYVGVWNPREDSGDALDLAADLGLKIEHGTRGGIDYTVAWDGLFGSGHVFHDDIGKRAAMRLAIVLVAATRGEDMP